MEITGNPFEEDLSYVRKKRMSLIETLEKAIIVTPGEGDEEEAPAVEGAPAKPPKISLDHAKVLLSALGDMGREALTNKRIKSDEGSVDKLASTREAIAMMFNDPRIKDIDRSAVPIARAAPTLPEGLVEVDLVPGELDQTSHSEDYKGFMERMKY